jgi:hypothetical protein
MPNESMLRRTFLGAVVSAYALSSTNALAATPSFRLEDQWERRVSAATVFSASVVLVGGDHRNTGDRVAEWIAKLDGLRAYGIADLQGVPFFIPRELVRSTLRSSVPSASVLLDWGGEIYTPVLGFPSGKEIVVQVHRADGTLIRRVEGKVSKASLAEVRKAAGT